MVRPGVRRPHGLTPRGAGQDRVRPGTASPRHPGDVHGRRAATDAADNGRLPCVGRFLIPRRPGPAYADCMDMHGRTPKPPARFGALAPHATVTAHPAPYPCGPNVKGASPRYGRSRRRGRLSPWPVCDGGMMRAGADAASRTSHRHPRPDDPPRTPPPRSHHGAERRWPQPHNPKGSISCSHGDRSSSAAARD